MWYANKTMKRIHLLLAVVFLFSTAAIAAAGDIKTTNVTVVAHEYYDEYQLPDKKRWQQVKSVKIEGQTPVNSTQVSQSGPGTQVEVTFYDLAVPSDYRVTIEWEGGERFSQTFTSTSQKYTSHHIYGPW